MLSSNGAAVPLAGVKGFFCPMSPGRVSSTRAPIPAEAVSFSQPTSLGICDPRSLYLTQPALAIPEGVEVHYLWCLPQEDACQDFAISCTA